MGWPRIPATSSPRPTAQALLTCGCRVLGGAGTITPSALEGANVDLADEFTRMIITQRAYSANARVITTTDQMLSELLQMSR